MQRARSDEAKERRREEILDAAARLVEERPFGDLTMALIARSAGIAKGTTYLYFRSKEELFLDLLWTEYAAFFAAARQALVGPDVGPDPASVAGALVDALRGRKRFLRLMEQLHVVLEQNVAWEVALAFKTRLRDEVLTTGAVLATVAAIPVADAARLLLRMHALVVGLRQMTRPSEVVVRVFERAEMEPIRIDFTTELRQVLADLLYAAGRAPAGRGAHP